MKKKKRENPFGAQLEVTRVVRVTFNTYSTDDYRIHAPKHCLIAIPKDYRRKIL